jgi:hypothetical protein
MHNNSLKKKLCIIIYNIIILYVWGMYRVPMHGPLAMVVRTYVVQSSTIYVTAKRTAARATVAAVGAGGAQPNGRATATQTVRPCVPCTAPACVQARLHVISRPYVCFKKILFQKKFARTSIVGRIRVPPAGCRLRTCPVKFIRTVRIPRDCLRC